MTNFDFLKEIDKNLFEIITDAEKLYRDEYFEQCMAQTRRFGEVIVKGVLGNNSQDTFDEMLATLKDKISGEVQEKEFVDDLYFLKKNGNKSVHSSVVTQDGMVALECLQRSFEVAINYAVYYCKADKGILRLDYDTELLITGRRKTKTLAEKYQEKKVWENRKSAEKPVAKKVSKPLKKEIKSQSHLMTPVKNKNKISIFWVIVAVLASISLMLVFGIWLVGYISAYTW